MNKYLLYNLFLILSIVVVVISTIISGYIAVKDNKLFNFSAYNIQLISDDQTSTVSTDSALIISKNSEILSDNFDIFVMSGSELSINKSLELQVRTGMFYINALKETKVNLGRGTLTIPANVKGIYNSKDSSFIIVSGQLNLENQTVGVGKYVVWGVDKFNVYSFDSNKYSTDNNLVAVINFLKEKESLPEELKTITRKKF